MRKEIIINNFEETQNLAKDFMGQILGKPEQRDRALVIALEGDLGGGKTTFAQGLAQGLGIKENLASPTFVLIKKYDIPISHSPSANRYLYHIDCYRLNKAWQMQELGFEEIINSPQNIVAIEWPEKIAEILPKDKITIKFEFIDENKRKITIEKNHSLSQN